MNDYHTHFAVKQYFIFYLLTDQVQRKMLREIHIHTLSSFRLGGMETGDGASILSTLQRK